MKRFTMTEQHIALLRHAYVGWDDCEFGAPCIDPKRPYGNSSVVLDICEILGVPVDDDGDGYGLDDATQERLTTLHQGTQEALQIVLATGRMEVGTYEADDYSNNWRKASVRSTVALNPDAAIEGKASSHGTEDKT